MRLLTFYVQNFLAQMQERRRLIVETFSFQVSNIIFKFRGPADVP